MCCDSASLLLGGGEGGGEGVTTMKACVSRLNSPHTPPPKMPYKIGSLVSDQLKSNSIDILV
jgi:hypothetical protein